MENAILLAIHAAARPKQKGEPIPREEMTALRLVVSPPENKFTAWMDAITEILRRMESTAKDLEQNIGRL
eukprot:12881033-Ditylum_brightwellii.AAC.1